MTRRDSRRNHNFDYVRAAAGTDFPGFAAFVLEDAAARGCDDYDCPVDKHWRPYNVR